MGRLALIADALNETAVAATVRGNMQAVLAPWLGDTNADKLLYDPSWGGVCSSAGLANGVHFRSATITDVVGQQNAVLTTRQSPEHSCFRSVSNTLDRQACFL